MKNPLWQVQPEGSEFYYPWFAPAWDYKNLCEPNYNVLVVIIHFNFLVRAILQLRLWIWLHSRFGPPPYEMTLKKEIADRIKDTALEDRGLIDLYISDFGVHRILDGRRPDIHQWPTHVIREAKTHKPKGPGASEDETSPKSVPGPLEGTG